MEIPIKKKSYSQKYRKEWEDDLDFKGWLAPVQGNDLKVQENHLNPYATLGYAFETSARKLNLNEDVTNIVKQRQLRVKSWCYRIHTYDMRSTQCTKCTRFLCCIPLDEAVTALGYFHASLAIASILAVLREIVTSWHSFMTARFYGSTYDLIHIRDMALFLLPLGLSVTLAIFLIIGIRKRRPGYMLAYIMLGVLEVLGLAIYWLVRGSTDSYYFVYEGGVEMVLVFFAYSLCLGAVYSSYRNMKLKEAHGNTYGLLQENAYGGVKNNVYCIDFLHVQK
ncbi:hypothetical protein EVAR_55942_1 [Eumeta japonica]|uniref:Uncharacterized protein n=1 Tax=Eumeta variegata TaxID=151549 RepID=A0A4C1YVA4_EUMVA|nr:hypothetical protein EVAR_55942_1 [Eumeta japonica]